MIEKIKAIIKDTDKNYAPYYQVLPDLIRKHKFTIDLNIHIRNTSGRAVRDSAIASVCDTDCRLNPYHPYCEVVQKLTSIFKPFLQNSSIYF
jgi:hypothetical protein